MTKPVSRRFIDALASAARTTAAGAATSDEVRAFGRRGIIMRVDLTLDPDTAAITVKLQAKDPISGVWADIPGMTTASIADTGHTVVTMYPGIGETANVSISDCLPDSVRVVSTPSGGTTLTYAVSLEFIP